MPLNDVVMKQLFSWAVVSALVLGLSSCESKKEQAQQPAPSATEPAQAPEPPVEPAAPPAPKIPVLSPEERAAKLGFAQYLPANTQSLISLHNGNKAAERVKASQLWQLIDAELLNQVGADEPAEDASMDEEEDLESDDGEQDPEVADEAAEENAEAPMTAGPAISPETYFGREFTFALGPNGSEQFGNLLTLNRRANFLRMRSLTRALAAAASQNDPTALKIAMRASLNDEWFKELLADRESGIGLYERMAMPPITLAFRATPETVDAAAQQISGGLGMLAMAGEMVQPTEADRNGIHFTGFNVSGKVISEQIATNRAGLEEQLDPETIDRLIAATATKNLVILTGKVLDYVVIFLGSKVEDFQLAASPANSLVAGEPLAFTDAYASKELALVLYGDRNLVTTASAAGGLADIAEGIREGLNGSTGLGETRDLEALLRMVGERESALLKLTTNEAHGMTAFFEDGLKLEAYGGRDPGAQDWAAPCRLAGLGASPDVALFANMTVLPEFDEKARAYAEAMIETGYALSLKATELPLASSDDDFMRFRNVVKGFDKDFRADVVEMWNSFYGDFNQGLGTERAWVLDLKGAMPPIPGVAQPLVDEAKIPRITLLAPVANRAKLAQSWESMNQGASRMAAKLGPLLGKEIPMQKPLSSEKNGYTTWFFGMPALTDDFMPSVTVGDHWFAASTSKHQALDLLAQAEKGSAGPAALTMCVNFKPMQAFSRQTLELCRKHRSLLFGENPPSEKTFTTIERSIQAFDEIDQLTIQCRREAGVMRTSMHWKTR